MKNLNKIALALILTSFVSFEAQAMFTDAEEMGATFIKLPETVSRAEYLHEVHTKQQAQNKSSEANQKIQQLEEKLEKEITEKEKAQELTERLKPFYIKHKQQLLAPARKRLEEYRQARIAKAKRDRERSKHKDTPGINR